MTKNVDELVLDAFFVEHREQLEQLRTLMASLQLNARVANDPRIRDAFRLAHSFKGGARVCDLREAEKLSHCLESVLEQLNLGQMEFSTNVAASITLTLDTIEDWMVALESDLPLPDTTDALTAMEQMLNIQNVSPTAVAESPKRRSRLFSVFSQEYAQQSVRLRDLLAQWNDAKAAPEDEQVTEAARLAHTLAGSSAIVDLPVVEIAARQLENLFRSILRKENRLDAASREQIAAALSTMAEEMGEQMDADTAHTSSAESHSDESPTASETATPSEDGAVLEGPSTSGTSHETVRVAVESLDRLMRSSSELSIDNQHVARLTRQVSSLQMGVSEFEREREILRRAALPSIHKLAAMPELAHVSRYLDYVEQANRQLRSTHERAVC